MYFGLSFIFLPTFNVSFYFVIVHTKRMICFYVINICPILYSLLKAITATLQLINNALADPLFNLKSHLWYTSITIIHPLLLIRLDSLAPAFRLTFNANKDLLSPSYKFKFYVSKYLWLLMVYSHTLRHLFHGLDIYILFLHKL